MEPLVELPAEWVASEFAALLLAGLVLAGIGTFALFVLSIGAYRQRTESRYLLVVFAVGALAARTLFGWGTVLGLVPMTIHHVVAAAFDFLIALLVLYAVYRSGSGQGRPDSGTERSR